ncbi:MAG: hypothetical protein ABSE73_33160 [Planctomycetota bacterium]
MNAEPIPSSASSALRAPHVSLPASNAVQLSGREWLVIAAFALALCLLAPTLWKRLEPFAAGPDYRLPYDLSNDYWLYSRYAAQAAAEHEVLVVGDSVVWGQYVTRNQTLSHYLNELSGRECCANLGLDGAHPAALAGLLEHYGGAIAGRKVVLVCNPLWLSSSKHDLQDEKEFAFNHPQLVPQFSPRIPCYKEDVSRRLSAVINRNLDFSAWTNHLQQAYFDRMDIPSWTLEHPYERPVKLLNCQLPPSDNSLRHLPVPWFQSGIKPQDYPWVNLNGSLQWRSFQSCVELLRGRGNRLLVVVGPFNEHMLADASREVYRKLKLEIAERLRAGNVACCVPEPLPSEEYGDASHPLSAGYRRLAEQLLQTELFK